MKPMNYSEFRKRKIKEFRILEFIWCLDEKVEVLYHTTKYTLRYIKSGKSEMVTADSTLWEYYLAEFKVNTE